MRTSFSFGRNSFGTGSFGPGLFGTGLIRSLLLLGLASSGIVTPSLAAESAKPAAAAKPAAKAAPSTPEKKHVAVFVNKETEDGDATVKLKVNGETWKFQLPTLADGEERVIATDDGRTVTAKRSGKDVKVTAGGETVTLNAEGQGMRMRFHGAPEHSAADFEAMKNSIVITGIELTEAEQQSLREACKKAGINKPLMFVKGGHKVMLHGHGPMVWNESGDGKAVRTVIVSKSVDGEGEEFKTEIEEIHGTEDQQ